MAANEKVEERSEDENVPESERHYERIGPFVQQ